MIRRKEKYYWVAVASKEHVMKGVQGGFAQVCHGKMGPLKQMQEDDWIVYYSPKFRLGDSKQCQAFTAIGQITGSDPYPFQMSEDFIPYRRDVQFLPAVEVSIMPLIDKLLFITHKKSWGLPFRRGCFSISKVDFTLIAAQMGVDVYSISG